MWFVVEVFWLVGARVEVDAIVCGCVFGWYVRVVEEEKKERESGEG